MTLIPHIRQADCNVISSLRIKKGLSSGTWLYGHPLLTLSTVTGSGLNCNKLKTPTGSTTSSFLISASRGRQERPSALL